MSLSASPITASCGLATNALRRKPGSSLRCPPHQMRTQSTTSTPSALIVEVLFIVSRVSLSGAPASRAGVAVHPPPTGARATAATRPRWADALGYLHAPDHHHHRAQRPAGPSDLDSRHPCADDARRVRRRRALRAPG